MLPTHAVGIDLGTTYSCIAYLNDHGEPVTIPNRDGELCTPSVVMFDGNQAIVGTEALRNSVRTPDRVVMHAKRHMGDLKHRWNVGGNSYSPIDISTLILRQLLADAKERIGDVERAVITVPAQFSDVHRQATAEAGRRAGLKHVDIINEPVAAALCFVLGTEGIWFTELATGQTIMVVDLGGGTFDLSLVRYEKNSVRVIASGGDLYLGGLDWNNRLEKAISKQFKQEFGIDPSLDRESKQALMLEVEQAKRSLSVRPKAALTCQAGGQRKTYQVELEQFERLTKSLVDQMEVLTKGLLAENKMGWAKVDVVLTTGGSSRMPMVRRMLKSLSGRTLNTSLSPDQSIAHGATYYSGMLLANNAFAKSILNPQAEARLKQFRQQSVNARALGILVQDEESGRRMPHYLLAANTQLPAEATQTVGTVIPNQRRAHLYVVESGTAADAEYVELGTCRIDPLPAGLPEGSEIEVTIRYDEQARVHVSAKEMQTGQIAHAEIVRPENLMVSTISEESGDADIAVKGQPGHKPILSPATIAKPVSQAPAPDDEAFDEPIPLCDDCGEALDNRGKCPKCQPASGPARRPGGDARPKARGVPTPAQRPAARPLPPMPSDDEIIELNPPPVGRPKAVAPSSVQKPKVKAPPLANPPPRAQAEKAGEEEFWKMPHPKKK
ncbi:MAG TPA: Hsp70 family protein [Planctomycetaceae bacterium]|nr:Hsp70 family protein [Planctomycetaceae bacterium]